MGFYSVVFCDRCNPKNMYDRGRLLFSTEEEAIAQFRWRAADYGIICPECVTELETERAAYEAAGNHSGIGIGAFSKIVVEASGAPEDADKVAQVVSARLDAEVAEGTAAAFEAMKTAPLEVQPKLRRRRKVVRQ